MARLHLSLLGPFQATLDGAPVTGFLSNKVRALLAYLAAEAGQPHPRESLIGLLWPDQLERSARANLNNALSNLRSILGDRGAVLTPRHQEHKADRAGTPVRPYLIVDRESVQFNTDGDAWVDVWEFQQQLRVVSLELSTPELETQNSRLATGIALYRGSFLEGFSLRDSPPFEHWALVTREHLQRQVAAALRWLSAYEERRGDYERAAAHARRQVELEPWEEQAQRELMRLLALSGQRGAALAQYEACVRALREELDVAPAAETTRLWEQIRSGALAPPGPATPIGTPMPSTSRSPRAASSTGATVSIEGQITSLPEGALPYPLPQEERRWATVLLAEVSGGEELVEELGSEGWAQAMREVLRLLEEEVTRYGGEVNQRRPEGIVALFGAGAAHEDDPERAILAALGMQEQVTRHLAQHPPLAGLGLRVGVEVGEVIVGHAGEGAGPREGTALGRAVLLAQRAVAGAEPGTAWVGRNAYRLAGPLFDWQPAAGGDALTGKPRAAYRALAHKGSMDKGRGIAGLASALVGRQAEVAAVTDALERLRQGMGGIVTLVGEAGIGKSRLVAEIRRDVPAERLYWAEGRCLSYANGFAYQVWLDMLRGLLGAPASASPNVVDDALRQRVRAWCTDAFDAVYPYLARLFSLPLTDEYQMERDLQGESLKAEVFAAVAALIEGAAGQQPLALVGEDLHWADPTSLELLERLLPLADRVPVLFFCVFRPETEHLCWRIKETAARLYRHRHTDLWLQPLSADESAELVGNLLRIEELPAALRTRILGHAEGNPFFVEEIVRSLINGGAIAYDEGAGSWRATGEVKDLALPDTLHGVLSGRIDRLPPEARRTLQMASVIGRVFSYRVLASLTGVGAQHAAPLLDARLLMLQRQQLIRERSRVPEREYIFKHELTREAAYDSLLRRERRVCHRRVAEALERLYPERVEEHLGLLAHHWERAEEAEPAIGYLLRAGDQARLAYANAEAIDYYQRALALLDNSALGQARKDRRLAAHRGLGIVYLGMGRTSEAQGALEAAIALGREVGLPPRDLMRLYYWLLSAQWWQGGQWGLISLGQEALALLGDDSGSAEAVLVYDMLWLAYYCQGDMPRSREFWRRMEECVQRVPYSEELGDGPYLHLADLSLIADRDVRKAMAWLHILEQQATAHHDLRTLGQVHAYRARFLWEQGDLRGAIPQGQQGVELVGRIGDAKVMSWCLRHIAEAYLTSGDLPRAAEYLRQHQIAVIPVEIEAERRLAHEDMALLSLCQGDAEEALETIQQIVSLRQFNLQGERGDMVPYLLGRTYLVQGRPTEALAAFREAVRVAASESLSNGGGELAWVLGALEETTGDAQAFREHCSRFQEEHLLPGSSPLVQWCLEPAGIDAGLSGLEAPQGLESPGWTWHDPFGDCSYTMRDGLEMRAANGRDLWRVNCSAPRLLRQAAGDLAMEVTCSPAKVDRPAIGGLLLWQDQANYVWLSRGSCGAQDICFAGCVANQDAVFGRGRLAMPVPGPVCLRLERVGDQVRALCRAGEGVDGQWFSVGQAAFPGGSPVQAGVCAMGLTWLGRAVYPGAYLDGTAMRFQSLQLWTAEPPARGR